MSNLELILLAVGLAVDASCLCTVIGLVHKPTVQRSVIFALPFSIFQGVMPLLGYWGVGLLPAIFFSYNHWIAFILLEIIGVKMLHDVLTASEHSDDATIPAAATPNPCAENKKSAPAMVSITAGTLLIQSFSTSIDALAVGVTLGGTPLGATLLAVSSVAVITFIICFAAIRIGQAFGTRFNGKAEIIGAIVLLLLGIQLLCNGLFAAD